MTDPGEFAVCLTHDVDRPYKTYQWLHDAITERDPSHVGRALAGENPYWKFEELMGLEERLGVRSAFYFLNEPSLFEKPPRQWAGPSRWLEHLGRYDVTAPEIREVIRRLDRGGWEVGLHGSYDSARDEERLRHEKGVLEGVLGHPIRGVRQHHLRLDPPETWRIHAAMGLSYDTSLGSSTTCGFSHGYRPIRPFDDDFLVFPLTIMEVGLPADTDEAWDECEYLLEEARENDAVMTVLWHPRYFDDREFPGYRELYERLVERAIEMGAWVGPPGEYYDRLRADTAAP
ncbi:polysaccharide deacetylase family protein [Halalkalicoccus sp. NIPERK01]|uniref:polysaccharide deacetylase family protein n=1 Tax=Halalkalicoccus sp. NIPERK01 TaxID=3053469 RepID=UPI00256F53C4|nr:polysaccharide deacetylase family protein [Halalkalicoccus sp. NIPERK01]MDL5360623.1 polysaccharide deacetylase family protein [Halalkalicoccus sp. NIPERK01]